MKSIKSLSELPTPVEPSDEPPALGGKLLERLEQMEKKGPRKEPASSSPEAAPPDAAGASPESSANRPPEGESDSVPSFLGKLEKARGAQDKAPDEGAPPADDDEDPPYPDKGKWSATIAEVKKKIRTAEGEKRKALEKELEVLRQSNAGAELKTRLEEAEAERDRLDKELAKVHYQKSYQYRKEFENPATDLIEKIRTVGGPKAESIAADIDRQWKAGTLDFMSVPDLDAALAGSNAVQKTAITRYLTDLVELSTARRARLEASQAVLADATSRDAQEYASVSIQAMADARRNLGEHFASATAELQKVPWLRNNAAFNATLLDTLKGLDTGDSLKQVAETVVSGAVYKHLLQEAQAELKDLRSRVANYEKGDRVPGNSGPGTPTRAPAGMRTLEALDRFESGR